MNVTHDEYLIPILPKVNRYKTSIAINKRGEDWSMNCAMGHWSQHLNTGYSKYLGLCRHQYFTSYV